MSGSDAATRSGRSPRPVAQAARAVRGAPVETAVQPRRHRSAGPPVSTVRLARVRGQESPPRMPKTNRKIPKINPNRRPKKPKKRPKKRRNGSVTTQMSSPNRRNGIPIRAAKASPTAHRKRKVSTTEPTRTYAQRPPKVPSGDWASVSREGLVGRGHLVQHEASAYFFHGDALGFVRRGRFGSASPSARRTRAPRRSCFARMAATST